MSKVATGHVSRLEGHLFRKPSEANGVSGLCKALDSISREHQKSWSTWSYNSSWLAGTVSFQFVPARRSFAQKYKGVVRAGFSSIFRNEVLVTTAAACVLCQGLKPFAALAEGKPLNWRLVYKSGGMPSSHTSSVTALATAVGLERGLDDDLFAICVVLACIVMYDAQGVRYAVGKQAEVLNSIVIPQISNPPPSMLNEAEQREAPQAEQLLAGSTERQASGSQTGPSRSPVKWAEATVGASGLERDTREAGAAVSDRATTSITDRLEEALSAPEGAAWINSIEEGRESTSSESGRHNPAYPSGGDGANTRGSNGAGGSGRLNESRSSSRTENAEGYPKAWRHIPLKEAVGHSKLEVAVGGLAGVVLAFAFHATVFGSHL